jgi:hypothetical protein
MIRNAFLPILFVFLPLASSAGVVVNYLDTTSEEADTINIRNLKAVEERNSLKEAQYAEKIKDSSEENKQKEKKIEELIAEIDLLKKETAEVQQKSQQILESARKEELAKKRKEALARDQNYELVIDNTQKIISYIGTPPAELPAVNSEGNDAPLKHAFASLVPLDWQLYLSKEIDKESLTTWDANGDNWLKGLYEIGTTYGYQYTVNWIDRWVLVNKSSLRLGGKDIIEPTIRVKGLNVEAGQKGFILIDGRLIEVESVRK